MVTLSRFGLSPGLRRADYAGLGIVLLTTAAVFGFRAAYVEPREWGAWCAAASAPIVCLPRAGLLWAQQYQLWGLSALLLGLWAFLGARLVVSLAAVALGIAAVANYNATWGMLGAALGAWSWIRRLRFRAPVGGRRP
jgi:hypothetical protein